MPPKLARSSRAEPWESCYVPVTSRDSADAYFLGRLSGLSKQATQRGLDLPLRLPERMALLWLIPLPDKRQRRDQSMLQGEGRVFFQCGHSISWFPQASARIMPIVETQFVTNLSQIRVELYTVPCKPVGNPPPRCRRPEATSLATRLFTRSRPFPPNLPNQNGVFSRWLFPIASASQKIIFFRQLPRPIRGIS